MRGDIELHEFDSGNWRLTSSLGREDRTNSNYFSDEDDDIEIERASYNGLEALILALATSGHEVTAPKFQEAVQTAIDAIVNNSDF